jgi:nitrogen fixation-related uncharacterized protein
MNTGNLILGIVIVASGVIGLAVAVVLFMWAAVKDGQDNDATQARVRDGKPS